MNKKQLLTIGIILLSIAVKAQHDTPSTKFSMGYQINQFQKDFGFGLQVTTPHFLKKSVAIRARTNVMFYEHIDGTEYTWTPYAHFTLGVVGVSGIISKNIRVYGEGGVILLLPSGKFSNSDVDVGGYGLFGFEFFMENHNSYFIEIGGSGTGATADKLVGKPIYSNGLLVAAGYRHTF